MIDTRRLIDRYLKMIQINSVYGNEKKLADFIIDELETIGLNPKVYLYDDTESSPSVVASVKGNGAGPKIVLIGHLDTVDVAKGWKTDPFSPQENGDRVYGLGAMDMKGGLSAIIETGRYFCENRNFNGEIILAFVSDEEFISRGTYALLKAGLKADMAIMAECRFDNAAVGFRGRYSFVVKVSGKAGHASKYPSEGENAVINASRLAIEIEKLPTRHHEKLGGGTWCIRSIEGGIKNTLSVPDACELFVDRYVVPGENADTCMAQITEAAKRLNLDHRITIELTKRPTPFMESFEIDVNSPLVNTLARHYKQTTGKSLPLAYDKSVCDSNYLSVIGNIPTITFGPSGGNMHGANEYGCKSEIIQATEIYKNTLLDILS